MNKNESEKLNELALFAGAGGGILGGKLLGWRTVCAVEYDAYAASVLIARQNDGCLAPFPIWDDVQTFDGKPWRGIIDVVSGGFPCQDISTAGRGAGIDGERSGLWGEMARIIGEVRPRYVLVENSPALTARGLGRVLGDLAAMGFNARWGVLGAIDAGAPHWRERIWIVANAMQGAWGSPLHMVQAKTGNLGDGREFARRIIKGSSKTFWDRHTAKVAMDGKPRIFPMVDGVAHHVDRLAAIGNGQVPAVVRLAWRILGPQRD